MVSPIRIAIADDHALFRQGLLALLRPQLDIEVVAELERAEDLVPTLQRTDCDVLLLDLQMERSTLSDIEPLAERVAVLVVTATERVEDAVAAIRAGARGVVFKRFPIETLLTAVHAVVGGQMWMPPALQADVLARLREPAGAALTRREREIVCHVARGLRNAEVAERLSISEVTVKTHVNNIFQKLGLRDRVELALYAVRMGMIGAHERRL
ncbi:MAG: response regulator transcription factor [Deltaproteobacteria bacterium]|nr:response regulator transcription factor [Deltaproteobacteria bacterium]